MLEDICPRPGCHSPLMRSREGVVGCVQPHCRPRAPAPAPAPAAVEEEYDDDDELLADDAVLARYREARVAELSATPAEAPVPSPVAAAPVGRAQNACLAKLASSTALLEAAGAPRDVTAAADAVRACAEALRALRDL